MQTRLTASLALLALALAACSSTPLRVAQNKSVQLQGKKLEFGGTYDEDQKLLRIVINGDPMLQGSFSRYSPNLKLNTKLDGLDVSASCYFGSILSKSGAGGIAGRIVANSVQGGLGKSADSCEMLVGDKKVETLFF